eukprot:1050014-Pleurochrysis_carterae.AAC.1
MSCAVNRCLEASKSARKSSRTGLHCSHVSRCSANSAIRRRSGYVGLLVTPLVLNAVLLERLR